MLPKRLRLQIQDFSTKSDTIFSGRGMVLKTAPNNLKHNRFGVVISSNLFKKTAERNKIRRHIYSLIEKNLSLPESEKVNKAKKDCLFIVRKINQLEREVNKALHRI
jgi:ribonuclease P protein component